MKPYSVTPLASLKGKVSLPGDKSIACRSIIISSISSGRTVIENFPLNKDCLSAVRVFRQLGIRIKQRIVLRNKLSRAVITVFAKGLYGLRKPPEPVFVGDSGTTLRLVLGVLAGQDFKVKLIAGKSLSQRPMRRVTEPLRMMGAQIKSRIPYPATRIPEEYAPIIIKGGILKPITYKIPVASAQVKSAILLAGLYPKGKTSVIEPIPTRDHTERMLKLFKAGIKTKKNAIVMEGGKELTPPKKLYIPGDISSAGFFMVLAAILPDSKIIIENVNLNPSRMGIVKILKRMGADIKITSYELRVTSYEPIGDIIVKSSCLRGTIVKKDEIPSLIDELPILMVAACSAKGKTILKGVGELRVKETDRIKSMTQNLVRMGAKIEVIRNGKSEDIIIEGGQTLSGARVRSFADHRTAMSMAVAGLKANGKTVIDDISCVDKSFPDFLAILHSLKK